ncbi:MAG: ATP-binding cassette domain-containing protein [Firmicutes bacterium]|nr:ATP-binding cassette domain-containing protein [Bacillota bacterium]
MLRLNNITKTYVTGDMTQNALNGISISFRKSEFVSILGQSGSGKTTLLNIIGGLDQYTSGDLIINGKSTKEYNDADWDAYRNHSIGFVFQNYNLIPHQSVLANVELALTLSGVSKSERRRRAIEALKAVGLEEHIHKKPNQMSGGQMQRVSIARALINNPDILLADEPTGALDSETSIQVMELLKDIAKDRLVIMVTHNPELAEKYSTRIVKLFDGRITDDTDPYEDDTKAPVVSKKEQKRSRSEKKKRSMSILTALSLSLNNLMTKKGRTFLTSFAGSIGIIGIALILALSTGINSYIDDVQEELLTSYPITIEAESVDMTSMITSLMSINRTEEDEEWEPDRVYSSTVMYDMLNSMVSAETTKNNLAAFKEYLDAGGGGISEIATIQYSYDFSFDVYNEDESGNIIKSDMASLLEDAMTSLYGGNYSAYFESMSSMYDMMSVWTELLPGEDGELISEQVKDQYEMVYGTWPESYDEVVLFVDSNNEISDLMLYALGILPKEQMTDMLNAMQNGETMEESSQSWSYEELCDTSFKLILPAECYSYDAVSGGYVDLSETEAGMRLLYESEEVGTSLKIVGIARVSGDSSLSSTSTGSVGYTSALTAYAIETANSTDIVSAQLEDVDTDVINGLPFRNEDDVEPTADEMANEITEYLSAQSDADKAEAYVDVMSQADDAYVESVVQEQMKDVTREAVEQMIVQQYSAEMGVDTETIMSYISAMSDEELMSQLEEAVASEIRLQYAEAVEAQLSSVPDAGLAGMLDAAFAEGTLTDSQYEYLYDNYMPQTYSDSSYEENLDLLGYVDIDSPSTINIYADTFSNKDKIADLIEEYNSTQSEENEINYTDYIALLMSSITNIINAISYLLIGFVAISLVVSSIMIGVITYISVLERTKEIGILRAIGASKRDVSRVFNAETLIVGLAAGLIGIVVTLLLIIPINIVVHSLTGIAELSAVLPVEAAVILVAISALLTIIAGLVPSGLAAKKNPVEALRTE